MNQVIDYVNIYGRLQLITVTDYRDIKGVTYKDIPDDFKYSIDDIGKLVLITGNRRIQVSLGYPLQKIGYIMHHKSASEVAICKIVSMDFDEKINATKELAMETSMYGFIS